MRLLAQNSLRYRRQILALKHFFAGRKCTVLLLDDLSSHAEDLQLHSIAHGVILLEQMALDYGAERRRLRVTKMRGIAVPWRLPRFHYRARGAVDLSAAHRCRTPQGVSRRGDWQRCAGTGCPARWWPAPRYQRPFHRRRRCRQVNSGLSYAVAAADRGEHAVLFAFDEGLGTIFARAEGLGIRLRPLVDAARLEIRQVDPAEMSPGEFASIVRDSVEKQNARVVIIDSLNGYLNSMPNEKFLILQMHELLSYLNQLGVVTILVLAQHGLMGPMQTPLDISYLSDTVVMLRYFEADGVVRRALSVVKKRSGGHEYAIREFRLGDGGVQVGPPLKQFRGIFTGTPSYIGEPNPLMTDPDNAAGP